jgi:hypothetical protein
MLLLLYTITITIGGWDKWIQYIFIPLPIIIGMGLVTFPLNPTYSIIILVNAYILVAYEVYHADSLRKKLIKFEPNLIFRFTNKGLLLIYTLLTAFLLVLSANNNPEINLGNLVRNYAGDSIETLVNTQLEATGVPKGLLGLADINIQATIENEVNKFIEPYKQFVRPVMALIAMGWIQLLGWIVLPIYSATSKLLVEFSKKTGFLNLEEIDVKQEILKF